MYLKNFYSIFLIIVCGGCSQGFYDYYQESDLWRLPLIDPYQLDNIVGADKDQANNDNWHLLFKHSKNGVYAAGVNVTMINVDKGIIFGYGTANPCQHFIINTKTEQERTFDKIEDWQNELKALNVDYTRVYDVFELFEHFKNEKKLMWFPQPSSR